VPFKDFRGNIHEAMTKVASDLKKFGYSGSKTLRLEQIKPGYGDQVCHIIDELLNLELYRRDFKFLTPVVPPDEEDEGDDEEGDDGGGNNEEAVIMINGGKIEAREIRDSPDITAKKGKRT
jgi:hypothetical protein